MHEGSAQRIREIKQYVTRALAPKYQGEDEHLLKEPRSSLSVCLLYEHEFIKTGKSHRTSQGIRTCSLSNLK